MSPPDPVPEFLPGVDLARLFYLEAVRPLLGDLPHIAARVGPGSDVLGYDSPRSTDHDWGPRLDLFLPGDNSALNDRLRHELPKRFLGWPTHFEPPGARVRSMADTDGPVDHYVLISELPAWTRSKLGFDPAGTITVDDWLSTPWQRFAEVTGGAVFHDPHGELTGIRERLRWYPDDLWRYMLACQWTRIGQEEAFVGRTAEAGDDLGSRILTARLCRDLARLFLLQTRSFPPYAKWLGTSIRTDPAAGLLTSALRAATPEAREAALCAAYEEAGTRQNTLGLSDTVPAVRRTFFERGYAVIDAGRYAESLRAALTEPALAQRPLTGSIDQICDNTDVLEQPERCRRLFGLPHLTE
ncbi:DUF4037 domain-containing protein [Actinoplanes sp. NPDC051861]|uniref:DUF4037 domain-containing protein n=1 Tax=Actinoplanes sp. NPDC051861 TaxID=3155170 RepID=UPI0034343A24